MAKNYMADVAALFGLRIGELFKLKEEGRILEMINEDGGYDEVVFWFTDDGIEYDSGYSVLDVDDESNVHLLFDIIVGEYEIVKGPWKPKKSDVYYYPDVRKKKVGIWGWRSDNIDYAMLALNMVYRTREEAEEHFAEDYKRLTGEELKQ